MNHDDGIYGDSALRGEPDTFVPERFVIERDGAECYAAVQDLRGHYRSWVIHIDAASLRAACAEFGMLANAGLVTFDTYKGLTRDLDRIAHKEGLAIV